MSKSLTEMSNEELWQLFPIILEPYNPDWKQWYIEEETLIRSTLGDHNIYRIRHIGSTSVPGLIAKPTVDILLEITKPCDLTRLTSQLESIGYYCEKKPENPEPHLMCMKGYTLQGFAEKVFHLHIRYKGDWNEPLFCDYLRSHSDVTQAYGQLKQQLKERYEHDRDGYTEAKSEFINHYTNQARREIASKRKHIILALLLSIAIILFSFLIYGMIKRGQKEECRLECCNNLKQMGMGLLNYMDCYGVLPPPYSVDNEGKRMHTLAYLSAPFCFCPHCWGFGELDYHSPWNSDLNQNYHYAYIDFMSCPLAHQDEVGVLPPRKEGFRYPNGFISGRAHWNSSLSNYSPVVGPGTAFPGDRTISLNEITDNKANTILLVERKRSLLWMDPSNAITLETALQGVNKTVDGIGSHHEGGAHVLMANGSVRFLPDSTTSEELRHLLLIADENPSVSDNGALNENTQEK